jgi:peptidoglycan/xylan/chitin deacetylase (PgdA/CDA1 family)
VSIRNRARLRTRLRSVIRRIAPPKPKPLILVYHRIANDPVDPWRLSVSRSHFEEHLQVLRRTRYPLPLADFVSSLLAGTLPSTAIVVTFDDGYVDNLADGKPLLAAADVPATVFLATGFTDRDEPFWWDELAKLILLEKPSKNFAITIGGKQLGIDSDNQSPVCLCANGDPQDASWVRRLATLSTVWEALRRAEKTERDRAMIEILSMFPTLNYRTSLGRAMSSAEVRRLASDGLITIGAHTVTHPMLTGLHAEACQREIAESRLACEALGGATILGFAYPFGDFNDRTRAAVKAAGFGFACSTQPRSARATSDVFALPRLHIPDMDGDRFERALLEASVV